MNDAGPQLKYAASMESRGGAAVAVLALEGELDLGVLDVLEQALTEGAGDRAAVVLDLTELTFVDSAGIHALVEAREGLDQSDTPSAVVVAPGSNVERILDMTGLLERLASQPDRGAALEAVTSAR
jgi:anti-anti-sigma factor